MAQVRLPMQGVDVDEFKWFVLLMMTMMIVFGAVGIVDSRQKAEIHKECIKAGGEWDAAGMDRGCHMP